jgi:hypothetical protein
MHSRILLILVTGAAIASAIACGESQPAGNTAGQPPSQPAASNTNGGPSPAGGDTAKIEPTVLKKEAGPDNSTIEVRQMQGGAQAEVRIFAAGPVEKVTRHPNAQKKTVLRVRMRDGSRYRVDDPETVQHALDWSGEQIAEAAKRVGKPIAPKESVDAGDGGEGADGKPADAGAKKPS